MNKRKVGADGELFSLDFPVAIPNVQKNPVHLVKMNLETPMRLRAGRFSCHDGKW